MITAFKSRRSLIQDISKKIICPQLQHLSFPSPTRLGPQRNESSLMRSAGCMIRSAQKGLLSCATERLPAACTLRNLLTYILQHKQSLQAATEAFPIQKDRKRNRLLTDETYQLVLQGAEMWKKHRAVSKQISANALFTIIRAWSKCLGIACWMYPKAGVTYSMVTSFVPLQLTAQKQLWAKAIDDIILQITPMIAKDSANDVHTKQMAFQAAPMATNSRDFFKQVRPYYKPCHQRSSVTQTSDGMMPSSCSEPRAITHQYFTTLLDGKLTTLAD